MSKRPVKLFRAKLLWQHLFVVVFSSSVLMPNLIGQPAQAQLKLDCQLSTTTAQTKEKLRLLALKGDRNAQSRYQKLLQEHAKDLQKCRSQNWPKIQAIWLRLYPCDIRPGTIDQIMDRIVNRGYNEVYVQAFYDGQVLLPAKDNPTVWPSVIRTPGAENVDLLSIAIQKGRQRGLKVYAWMFTTNFGYTYAQRADRESAIARNGRGETSLYVVDNGTQVFIDPYNKQAQRDYFQMVQQVLRRRPDGLLFDYIRYPRQAGSNSLATKVSDLWLFTQATQEALFRRALNSKGLELIRRFLSQGYVTIADIDQVDQLYPQEGEPMWQGRIPSPKQKALLSAAERQPILQVELWQLMVAHAMQGILDFVNLASYPAKKIGIPSGVVFFPDGNQAVGEGYDSRLQPWDRFPDNLQWHPMAYAACDDVSCVAAQVQRVVKAAKPGTKIIPALAGTWGQSTSNRPSLEAQMQALRKFAPQLQGVSHFAYSWQYPENDSDRKFCRLR